MKKGRQVSHASIPVTDFLNKDFFMAPDHVKQALDGIYLQQKPEPIKLSFDWKTILLTPHMGGQVFHSQASRIPSGVDFANNQINLIERRILEVTELLEDMMNYKFSLNSKGYLRLDDSKGFYKMSKAGNRYKMLCYIKEHSKKKPVPTGELVNKFIKINEFKNPELRIQQDISKIRTEAADHFKITEKIQRLKMGQSLIRGEPHIGYSAPNLTLVKNQKKRS